MIAETAAKTIAPFVDKQWPEDKEDIFQILKLGVNKAWQEGRWFGMTAEYFLPIQRDRYNQSYIIAPTSHPILLATNINGCPQSIRDVYFQFHKNGNGKISKSDGCSWVEDVYDMGTTPFLPNLNINFDKGVLVGVRAIGLAGDGEYVYINGKYKDGNSVYTYEHAKGCACKVSKDEVDTINGIRLDISSDFNYISNIKFSEINKIVKTITRTPIEVSVIDPNTRTVYPIAMLAPNQKESKYRKYLVPTQACKHPSFHGVFKIAQQEDIVHPNDELVISNEEAIISLCKGVHQIYWKEQTELGAAYVLQGISILEKEKRQEESPNQFTIQVDPIMYADIPDAFRHNY